MCYQNRSNPYQRASPFLSEGNTQQQAPDLGPTHADDRLEAASLHRPHVGPRCVDSCPSQPSAPSPQGTTACHELAMTKAHPIQHPPYHTEQATTTAHKQPKESSMSYHEAIELMEEYSPQALEAIRAAHFHSTRPVIFALKDENIRLKRLLQFYANAYPNFVDPSQFQNIYAEQPEAYPLPAPMPLFYGPPYTPPSHTSSNSPNAITRVSLETMPPTAPYALDDAMAPPSMAYYPTQATFPPALRYDSREGTPPLMSYTADGSGMQGVYDGALHRPYSTQDGFSRTEEPLSEFPGQVRKGNMIVE